ncbi:AAEL017431-PA [Aedes aegypti]|uniref:AAEL017431-PA n=1 Tax=Aedes aegypti TaxID=7159 RepID=J9HYH1_AEDAE|nr:AAEL017431-PA [Aedes aegypti]
MFSIIKNRLKVTTNEVNCLAPAVQSKPYQTKTEIIFLGNERKWLIMCFGIWRSSRFQTVLNWDQNT